MKSDTGKLPALVDTNLLVYAYAESSPNSQRAAALLDECFSGKISLVISLQNMGEFCHVALRKYKLDPLMVQKVFMHLLECRTLIKVAYLGTTLLSAITLSATSKLEFWDALLAATMLENGIDTIYTEDADFGKIEGIKAINPF